MKQLLEQQQKKRTGLYQELIDSLDCCYLLIAALWYEWQVAGVHIIREDKAWEGGEVNYFD